MPGGYVTAYSASTGERLWRTVRDDECASGPVQAGSSILVSHRAEVWAYDDRTGTPRWGTADDTAAGVDPLVGGGRLYVTTDSGIHAILT
ncbi:outer membrane protein assembly factor BamB family protein [Streptomyces solicavernae]|uniref:outer membrane protein assembly factor BamB family protein n=1 Tax=Streptomyces solicavernae TaxID=3043614 RepID=UPI0038D08F5B